MQIKTGKGQISLMVVLAIWSLSCSRPSGVGGNLD